MRKAMNTVDLFCGAGGASTGMCDAFDEAGINHRGLCINHWSVAVDTMKLNHPDLETKRMSIEEAVPADLVRSGVVDLLWASPSCTHHSRAKGGRPRSNRLRSLSEPMRTQHTCNRTAIVRPFVVRMRNSETAQSVDDPINTISAGGQHHMLCQPFIVKMRSHATVGSVDNPLTTVSGCPTHYICNPMILDHKRNGKVAPVSSPIGAQTTHDRYSVITPMVLGQNGGSKCQPVDRPCPTIATKGAVRMITPIIIDMSHPGERSSGRVSSADSPVKTMTTRNNTAAVFPILEDGSVLDVRIRMLKPSELAAAHSFPADYVLTGTKCDQVKQIGNSVPVRTAKAMCLCDIRELVK